jgi:hypothetical protein
MKTRLSILWLIAGILLISSCATTTRYTSSNTFEDAVYQRPQSGNYIVVNTQQDSDINRLRNKTKESNAVFINGKLVEPVYANEKGEVNINLEQEKTYIILQEGESFEDRLTMFDSPNYNINITFSTWDFYNPWYWDMYYIPRPGYRFGGSLYYHPWYNPWYRPWYSPVYSYWGFYNNPWYWGWNRHFYWGWEMDHYMGWNSGGYWWPRHPHTSHRDRYYGIRENPRRSDNYYRNQGAQSGGSYRRDGRVEQIRGGNENIQSNSNRSESLYRRDSRRNDSRVRTTYQTQSNIERTNGESIDRRGSGGTTMRRESGTTSRNSGNQQVNSNRNSNRSTTYRPSSTSTARRSSIESNRSGQSTTQRSSGNVSTQSRSSYSRSNSGNSSTATRSSSSSTTTSSSSRSSSTSSSSSSSSRSSGSSSGYRR